nr:hypothetical protein [Providencia stuartii]
MKISEHSPSLKYINQTITAHAEMLKRGNMTPETISESCRIKRNNLEAKYKFLNETNSIKPISITLPTPVKFDDNAFKERQAKIDAAMNIANILKESQLPSLPSLSLPLSYSLKSKHSTNTIKEHDCNMSGNQSAHSLNIPRPTTDLRQKLEQLRSKCERVAANLDANSYSAESLKVNSMIHLKKLELNASLIGTDYSELDLVWYMDKKAQTQSEKEAIIKNFTPPKPIAHQKGSRIPLKIPTITQELDQPRKKRSIHQATDIISSHSQGKGRVIINGQVKRDLSGMALSPSTADPRKTNIDKMSKKEISINHTKNINTKSARACWPLLFIS